MYPEHVHAPSPRKVRTFVATAVVTLALFHSQAESAGRTWDEVLQPTLRNHQRGCESGCALGSWPPAPDDAEARRGGRLRKG